MVKIPDAKEAKTFVSTPAEAKLTTVGPMLVSFAIIYNNRRKVDIISFLPSIDQCSPRGISM